MLRLRKLKWGTSEHLQALSGWMHIKFNIFFYILGHECIVSQSPVQYSAHGSVIQSFILISVFIRALFYGLKCLKYKYCVNLTTFNRVILISRCRCLYLLLTGLWVWHWRLNDPAIIRRRRQRHRRWRRYRISEIHSSIFGNIPSRGVNNENLQAIRNRCFCLCNMGLHHSKAKCSR